MDTLDLGLTVVGAFLIAQAVFSWEWFWELRDIGRGAMRSAIRVAFLAIGGALVFFAVFA